MPYVTEEDKSTVGVPIKDMLTKLIQEESGNGSIKTEDEPTNKKSRLSGNYKRGVKQGVFQQ